MSSIGPGISTVGISLTR